MPRAACCHSPPTARTMTIFGSLDPWLLTSATENNHIEPRVKPSARSWWLSVFEAVPGKWQSARGSARACRQGLDTTAICPHPKRAKAIVGGRPFARLAADGYSWKTLHPSAADKMELARDAQKNASRSRASRAPAMGDSGSVE